jgi:hypothetical protein
MEIVVNRQANSLARVPINAKDGIDGIRLLIKRCCWTSACSALYTPSSVGDTGIEA